jgi:hypothetical protein
MAGDENTIAQTYSNYVQAFQTLDRRAVLPYCHVPCMFVSPQGVRIMETPSEVESLFNRVMEGPESTRLCAEPANGLRSETNERGHRFSERQPRAIQDRRK